MSNRKEKLIFRRIYKTTCLDNLHIDEEDLNLTEKETEIRAFLQDVGNLRDDQEDVNLCMGKGVSYAT